MSDKQWAILELLPYPYRERVVVPEAGMVQNSLLGNKQAKLAT